MLNSTEHEISNAHNFIKGIMVKNEDFSCFKTLRCIYPAKNVKMPTFVGILTLISRINSKCS